MPAAESPARRAALPPRRLVPQKRSSSLLALLTLLVLVARAQADFALVRHETHTQRGCRRGCCMHTSVSAVAARAIPSLHVRSRSFFCARLYFVSPFSQTVYPVLTGSDGVAPSETLFPESAAASSTSFCQEGQGGQSRLPCVDVEHKRSCLSVANISTALASQPKVLSSLIPRFGVSITLQTLDSPISNTLLEIERIILNEVMGYSTIIRQDNQFAGELASCGKQLFESVGQRRMAEHWPNSSASPFPTSAAALLTWTFSVLPLCLFHAVSTILCFAATIPAATGTPR
jgi:hypothetical protein